MDYAEIKKNIINELDKALGEATDPGILVKEIVSCGKVFVTGAGRARLMMQAFAKRLGHLGIEVYVIGETVQPPALPEDLLIIASGSGKSAVPLAIAKEAKELGMKVALITARKDSDISKISDLAVLIPASIKLDSPGVKKSLQPLSNHFEQSLLIFCDITALLVQESKGLSDSDIQKKHANLE